MVVVAVDGDGVGNLYLGWRAREFMLADEVRDGAHSRTATLAPEVVGQLDRAADQVPRVGTKVAYRLRTSNDGDERAG